MALIPGKTYKIYFLIDPVTAKIRYVGQTSLTLDRRLYYHMYRSNEKSYKNSWIKSLVAINEAPLIECIETLDNLEECNNREIYWIDILKRNGIKLTNLVGGGNVTSGYKFTEEQKLKMRGRIPWNKGKDMNKTTKNKISNTLIKYFKNNGPNIVSHSDATKKLISETNSDKVEQYDKNMNIIKKWDSITSASNTLYISGSGISRACSGERKTAGGFIWKKTKLQCH